MKTANEIKEMMKKLEQEENKKVLTKDYLDKIELEIIFRATEGYNFCSFKLEFRYDSSFKLLKDYLESLGYKITLYTTNIGFKRTISFDVTWWGC